MTKTRTNHVTSTIPLFVAPVSDVLEDYALMVQVIDALLDWRESDQAWQESAGDYMASSQSLRDENALRAVADMVAARQKEAGNV